MPVNPSTTAALTASTDADAYSPDVDSTGAAEGDADGNAGSNSITQGQHRAKHREGRLKIRICSWLVQLSMWTLFVVAIIAVLRYATREKKQTGQSRDYDSRTSDLQTQAYFHVALFLFFYFVVYLWGCMAAGTHKFVGSVDREVNVQQYVEHLRCKAPAVHFYARCYHDERRTRQVAITERHANGETHTRYETETYTELVVTHTATEEYMFERWEDATPVLPGTDEVKLTKLHLSKELGFMSDESRDKFFADFNAFCAENCFDRYQDFTRKMTIEGFKEHVLCFRNASESPWWVSSGGYWVASILLMNVPYRVLLDWQTGIVRHTITKKIS